MHMCSNLPTYRIGPMVCNGKCRMKLTIGNYSSTLDILYVVVVFFFIQCFCVSLVPKTASAVPFSHNYATNASCVNWNQYYTNCTQLGSNPFQGTISFDNIGLAWVAIFLVISLEGWTDIMYYVQDAHSFWDWIYFVLLIVVSVTGWFVFCSDYDMIPSLNEITKKICTCLHQIGSFFMINLCLVVIATQFSETKKREMERMRQERARYTSSSTIASSTNNSEPSTCYAEIVKYIAHLWRRGKRRLIKKLRYYKYALNLKHQPLFVPKSGTINQNPPSNQSCYCYI